MRPFLRRISHFTSQPMGCQHTTNNCNTRYYTYYVQRTVSSPKSDTSSAHRLLKNYANLIGHITNCTHGTSKLLQIRNTGHTSTASQRSQLLSSVLTIHIQTIHIMISKPCVLSDMTIARLLLAHFFFFVIKYISDKFHTLQQLS